ncbi:unnamed protein product [Owenia fusiformis]|uniref:Uncharacterized protein n=1 Tax=Owenia fusiformis TaxID=6347 RepID=A0A8S4Q2U5_OWEFU|nr:unnamed protein product [Owenia fusiformis]
MKCFWCHKKCSTCEVFHLQRFINLESTGHKTLKIPSTCEVFHLQRFINLESKGHKTLKICSTCELFHLQRFINLESKATRLKISVPLVRCSTNRGKRATGL